MCLCHVAFSRSHIFISVLTVSTYSSSSSTGGACVGCVWSTSASTHCPISTYQTSKQLPDMVHHDSSVLLIDLWFDCRHLQPQGDVDTHTHICTHTHTHCLCIHAALPPATLCYHSTCSCNDNCVCMLATLKPDL